MAWSPYRQRVRSAVCAWAALAGVVMVLNAVPASAYAGVSLAGQWQLATLHASAAWRYSTGTGVTVAVLDSGVDANHTDLRGQVLRGADFVDGTTDGRRDFVGHGTSVAGLIAGRNKTTGVVGLAPEARILPVRVLDKQNRYNDATTVARGLRWAVDHGARVVNLSLGGGAASTELAGAIEYAYQQDVVVIACTGNVERDASRQVWFPARVPGVVAVSGLTETSTGQASRPTLWGGALTGTQTVLTAPAVDLLAAKPGGYWRVEGTSFAAPLVTAVAAMIRARWPAMNAANVINRLIRTADDLGRPGWDATYGYGEVDPVAALTANIPAVATNPLLGGDGPGASSAGASA
ncbi:MAG: type VII secretion-associated serine protease mycosin, partial [Micromonosporaceae bacterium]|nr:type VII secretion-associated serine protease mycosin [Micromonosporaceae bacterium]